MKPRKEWKVRVVGGGAHYPEWITVAADTRAGAVAAALDDPRWCTDNGSSVMAGKIKYAFYIVE